MSAAVHLGKGMRGLIMRSRYVRRRAQDLRPTALHRPRSPLHLLLQGLSLFPITRRLGWWFSLRWAFAKPIQRTDEVFGYTFFQDGNENIKRLGRWLGLRLGARQQTYVIPWKPGDRGASARALARFLDAARRRLAVAGLVPAMVDVLYLPGDTRDGFLLSSTRGMAGFAVSIAFERVVTGGFAREEAALADLARTAAELGGRVHLVKHVFADPALLEAMYPQLDAWLAVKQRLDPDWLLRNEFLARVFPRAITTGAPG